jgi:hypothetical protein
VEIAAVHGTILSIIVGIFAAYALSAFGKIDEQIHRALRVAEKIHRLPLSLPLVGGPLFSPSAAGTPDLDNHLTTAIEGENEYLNTPADRGMHILRAIAQMPENFPFSVGGRRPFGLARFRGLKHVEEWIAAVELRAHVIESLNRRNEQHIREALEAIGRRWGHEDSLDTPELMYTARPTDPVERAERFAEAAVAAWNFFRDYVTAAAALAAEAKPAVEEARALLRRMPPKWMMMGWSLFAAVAFGCGVVAPLYRLNLSATIWRDVPVAFYLFSFVLILVEVYRSYPRLR